jgi:hypothetical protein
LSIGTLSALGRNSRSCLAYCDPILHLISQVKLIVGYEVRAVVDGRRRAKIVLGGNSINMCGFVGREEIVLGGNSVNGGKLVN